MPLRTIGPLLALLCVLAGCATTPTTGPAAGGTTTGDGEQPTTATTTAAPSACEPTGPDRVPGVTDGRVTDLDALLAANAERLDRTGYVVVRRLAVRTTYPDATNWTRIETLRVDADDEWNRTSVTRIHRPNGSTTVGAESALYAADGDGRFRERTDDDPEWRYRTVPVDGPPVDTLDADRLRRYARGGNYTFAARKTVDGRTLYLFTADGYRAGVDLPVAEERYDARLLVDGCGRLASATVAATAVNATTGDRYGVTFTYDLRRTGDVDVRRPGWVNATGD